MYECPLTARQIASMKELGDYARQVKSDADLGRELASRAKSLMLSMSMAGDAWKEHVADITAAFHQHIEVDPLAHYRPVWSQQHFEFAPAKFAEFLDDLAASCETPAACNHRKELWKTAVSRGVFRPGLTDAALKRRLVNAGHDQPSLRGF